MCIIDCHLKGRTESCTICRCQLATSAKHLQKIYILSSNFPVGFIPKEKWQEGPRKITNPEGSGLPVETDVRTVHEGNLFLENLLWDVGSLT